MNISGDFGNSSVARIPIEYVADSDGTFSELIVLDPEGLAPVVRIPTKGNVGNGSWQRLP